jgi:hypothetical protein
MYIPKHRADGSRWSERTSFYLPRHRRNRIGDYLIDEQNRQFYLFMRDAQGRKWWVRSGVDSRSERVRYTLIPDGHHEER